MGLGFSVYGIGFRLLIVCVHELSFLSCTLLNEGPCGLIFKFLGGSNDLTSFCCF